jgi:hypothetical protein
LHIWDVCDKEYIREINKSSNPPKYIVNDSLNFIDIEQVYCSNFWLEQEVSFYKNFSYCEDTHTDYVFNFMINKKQINRFLCMKLVEYFGLKDFAYTWSGIGRSFDMSKIIEERSYANTLPEDLFNEILAPVKSITPNFLSIAKHDISNNCENAINVEHYGQNYQVWENVASTMFKKSAISLITESIAYDKSICFSEKTLFAVLGLTFPIWIGGYRQSEEWKKTGFDTFDDVINHNYQYYDTLIERCYHAFNDNLHLLTNKQKISKLRCTHKNRLLRNRELILNNQIQKYNDNMVSQWPIELQQVAMPTINKHFRHQHP